MNRQRMRKQSEIYEKNEKIRRRTGEERENEAKNRRRMGKLCKEKAENEKIQRSAGEGKETKPPPTHHQMNVTCPNIPFPMSRARSLLSSRILYPVACPPICYMCFPFPTSPLSKPLRQAFSFLFFFCFVVWLFSVHVLCCVK